MSQTTLGVRLEVIVEILTKIYLGVIDFVKLIFIFIFGIKLLKVIHIFRIYF